MLFNRVPQLIAELDSKMKGAIDGTLRFGNPIGDYAASTMPIYNASVDKDEKKDKADTIIQLEETEDEGGEPGFLDYLSEIMEKTDDMNREISNMGQEIERMSESINSSSEEIDRINKSTGKNNPVLLRNICRKLADPIKETATSVKIHVDQISIYWEDIVNSFLLLLDNRHLQENDIDNLVSEVESLKGFQNTIEESNSNVIAFQGQLKAYWGIEKRLTNALVSLSNELDGYIVLTQTMVASIERILEKGKMLRVQK